MSPPHPRRPPILWHVVQEHLDEAAYFWRMRRKCLGLPDHGLADLADGEERRLLAHMEGLRIGGPRVAERLLVPALEEGEGPVRAVAAYTLLAVDAARFGPLILRWLEETPPEERDWLQEALALSPAGEVDSLLRDALPGASPELGACLLEVLRLRQAEVAPVLARLPLADSPAVLAAALRAARHAPEGIVAPLVTRGLDSPDVRCRDAALEVGWARGLFAAAEWCRRALSTGDAGRAPLTALAMSGDRRAVPRLVALLEHPAYRAEALWALGLNGRTEALEVLLKLVRSEADPLAAESLRLITGIPLETYLAPPGDDEAPEEAEPDEAASFLPGPTAPPGRVRADAVDAWWREHQPRFSATGGRYVWGRTWTPEAALQALLEVPVTRRAALAWELAVRSGGACRVETGTWAWVQVRQVRAARGLRMDQGARLFEAVLGAG